jgi:hypothetical protein
MAGSLTGGGQIRSDAPGRRVGFDGGASLAIDGASHGEFQVGFHDVSNPHLSGSEFRGTPVDGVTFLSDEAEEGPGPPQALFDEVHFEVSGELDGVPCRLRVDATDHGEPASGGSDADAIRLRLDCPGAWLDYDTALDFPEEEAPGLHRLDSGNLQIHAPE